MSSDLTADYLEADAIAAISPRGAAALLRLIIDKLTKELAAEGPTIDRRIQSLVDRGLDVTVQQMLDSVRVIGNDAVHPGQIDLRDDPLLLRSLFWIINEIVEELVSKPKRIAAIYETLPQQKREAIEERAKRAAKSKSHGK